MIQKTKSYHYNFIMALLQKDFKIEINSVEYITTEDIRVEFPDSTWKSKIYSSIFTART